MKEYQDALAVSKARAKLLSMHDPESSVPYGDVYFTRPWRKNTVTFIASLERLCRRAVRDVYGDPLYRRAGVFGSRRRLRIALNETVTTARITPQGPDSILIEISPHLVSVIDLQCSIYGLGPGDLLVYRKDEYKEQPLSLTLDEGLLARLRHYGIKDNIALQEALYIFCAQRKRHGGKGGRYLDTVYERWARRFLAAMYFLVMHEVGHHLCGHLGFFIQQSGSKGLSEADDEPEGSAVTSLHFDGRTGKKLGQLPVWSSELMADTYGVIQLALLLDRMFRTSAENATVDEFPESEVLNLILMPLFSITALLGFTREKLGENDRNLTKRIFDISKVGYPTEMCRLVNVVAAFTFCVFPLPNAVHSLPNLFTKELFGRLVARLGSRGICAELSSGIAESIAVWQRLGFATEAEIAAIIDDIDRLWACVGFMRVGMTLVLHDQDDWPFTETDMRSFAGKPLFEAMAPEIREMFFHYIMTSKAKSVWIIHMSIWNYAMRFLTTYFNGQFANHIPKHLWVKGIKPPQKKATDGKYVLSWTDGSHDALGEGREFSSVELELAVEMLSSMTYTRDPAYHVIDSWMSQMQNYFCGYRYSTPETMEGTHLSKFDREVIGCIQFGIDVKNRYLGDAPSISISVGMPIT
jgi:hypothetical protein